MPNPPAPATQGMRMYQPGRAQDLPPPTSRPSSPSCSARESVSMRALRRTDPDRGSCLLAAVLHDIPPLLVPAYLAVGLCRLVCAAWHSCRLRRTRLAWIGSRTRNCTCTCEVTQPKGNRLAADLSTTKCRWWSEAPGHPSGCIARCVGNPRPQSSFI